MMRIYKPINNYWGCAFIKRLIIIGMRIYNSYKNFINPHRLHFLVFIHNLDQNTVQPSASNQNVNIESGISSVKFLYC